MNKNLLILFISLISLVVFSESIKIPFNSYFAPNATDITSIVKSMNLNIQTLLEENNLLKTEMNETQSEIASGKFRDTTTTIILENLVTAIQNQEKEKTDTVKCPPMSRHKM